MTMSKIVSLVIGVILVLAVIAFSVNNLGRVAVDLWPLPYTANWPVFVVVLVSIAIGLLIGLLIAWLAGGRSRKVSRARRREVKSLEKKLQSAAPRDTKPAALPGQPAR